VRESLIFWDKKFSSHLCDIFVCLMMHNQYPIIHSRRFGPWSFETRNLAPISVTSLSLMIHNQYPIIHSGCCGELYLEYFKCILVVHYMWTCRVTSPVLGHSCPFSKCSVAQYVSFWGRKSILSITVLDVPKPYNLRMQCYDYFPPFSKDLKLMDITF
jgi:hypothetical protein